MTGLALELSPEAFAAFLGKKADALAHLDLTPAWARVAAFFFAQSQMSFVGSRSPAGAPWAPLKNPSAARGGARARPLRDTERLMRSFGAGAEHVERVTATSLVWGTAVPYAGFHQFGTRRIPARPFLGLTPAAAETVGRIVAAELAKAFAGA